MPCASGWSKSCGPPREAVGTVSRLMCGIVGYVGDRAAQEILLAGLQKLEYRGYDSAGLSMIADGEIDSVRAVGSLENLVAAWEREASNGSVVLATRPATIGIGHTR